MYKFIFMVCLLGLNWMNTVNAQPFKNLRSENLTTVHYKKSFSNILKTSLIGHQLPLIVIDTNGGTIIDDPKITVSLKVIDNGTGNLNYMTDKGNNFDGLAGIEFHGQSSQMFPKKSYSIETRDNTGASLNAGLLGMPAESDWILYAPYSDKTMLRNALTYYLAGRFGRWQPRFRFCEIYLNGDYIGVYQITEKIKRGKNRVNVAKLSSTSISGNDITGGYLFKVDKIGDLPLTDYFYSTPSISFMNARNYAFTYVYPKPEDIVTEQKNYLASQITNFQNSLNGSSFMDSIIGYRGFIDVGSFVDFEIINELTNNVDGYRYSTFFNKQKDSDGGKIIAGPVWDFDLGYGNVDYSPRNLSVTEWVYPNFGPDEGYCMHWWARLMQDPVYTKKVKNRWTQLRDGPLHRDSIESFINNNVQQFGDAIERNFAKWPIIGVYVWPNYYVGSTYQSEIDYLKDWISRRITWMDSQWLIQTGIDELKEQNSFKLYPNPFQNKFTIELFLNRTEDIGLELYNSAGIRVHKEIRKNQISGYQEIQINAENLRRGVYILKIIPSEGKTIMTKVLCIPEN